MKLSSLLIWLNTFKCVTEALSGLQSVEIGIKHWVLVQEGAVLQHGGPPHTVAQHAVGSGEPVAAGIGPAHQVLREVPADDVELGGESVDEHAVPLLLGRVRQLHVQWLQCMINNTAGVSYQTIYE